MSLVARWESAAHLLADHRDVLEGRPDEGDAPLALTARGWAEWLLRLSDEALESIEASGHDAAWPADVPAGLRALIDGARVIAQAVRAGGRGGEGEGGGARGARAARRGETPRKRTQIEAFAGVVAPFAAAAKRVIDVGSGHGHLTRDIAERIAVPVIGLERDVALAERARELSPRASPAFAITDVLRDGLSLRVDDLVIGLHACGELGDAMVESAARAGSSVVLVGCCLQKRRAASRAPLCDSSGLADRLDLPRALLGLSNLSAGDDGVEATRAENLAARERRLALHRLLRDAVGELRLGAEIEGLNRRAAHGELASLVARAFALRGLDGPAASALASAATWAKQHHARTRRLALPRSLLARPLEVFVLLDRALHLERHGFTVGTVELFPTAVSARNLALLASRQ